jgi:hypothetical protein
MKSYLQSRMFWAGIATVAAAVIDAGYQAYVGSGDFRTVVLAGVGALVIVLRKYTSSEIVFTTPQKARQLHAQRVIGDSVEMTSREMMPEQRRDLNYGDWEKPGPRE